MMNGQVRQDHDYRFLTGLALGGAVGAGLALWLTPKATAEMTARAVDSVKSIGNAASEQYRDAKLKVSETVDELTRKGQGVRDAVSDTVVRGAQDVQRMATDAKTHIATDPRTHKAS